MGKARLVFVIGLLLAGGSAYVFRDELAPAIEKLWHGRRSAGMREPRDNTVPVIATPVTRTDVPLYVTGVGTVRPANTVVVRAQGTGKIGEIGFREGQDMRKGDIIARLDDALYKAQRDQAVARKKQDEALLGGAEDELARLERLAGKDTGTPQHVPKHPS